MSRAEGGCGRSHTQKLDPYRSQLHCSLRNSWHCPLGSCGNKDPVRGTLDPSGNVNSHTGWLLSRHFLNSFKEVFGAASGECTKTDSARAIPFIDFPSLDGFKLHRPTQAHE